MHWFLWDRDLRHERVNSTQIWYCNIKMNLCPQYWVHRNFATQIFLTKQPATLNWDWILLQDIFTTIHCVKSIRIWSYYYSRLEKTVKLLKYNLVTSLPLMFWSQLRKRTLLSYQHILLESTFNINQNLKYIVKTKLLGNVRQGQRFRETSINKN